MKLTFLIPALALLMPTTALWSATVDDGHIHHVLLISVDGMHAIDLDTWIAAHPASTLARLSDHGITYDNALCGAGVLSDSFPGLAALVTGGGPGSTGLWYDDSWDRALHTRGSSAAGTETTLFEALDWDFSFVDGGVQHVRGQSPHYGVDAINPDNLPTRDGSTPVWPHQIQRLNTIFEVARNAGLYTAWSDKHPAYEWVMGPSGSGLDDFFAPEINSYCNADGSIPGPLQSSPTNPSGITAFGVNPGGWDLTSSEASVQGYDALKVAAIINQIDGRTALGGATTPAHRVPNLFGMNFQAVSVGQKLRHDPLWANGTTANQGGYVDAQGTPSAPLASALAFVDAQLGTVVDELKAKHLYDSTLIIITAKHGQSPIDPLTLAVEKPAFSAQPVVADPVNQSDQTIGGTVGFNAADGIVESAPGGPIQTAGGGLDDVYLIWLKDQGQTAQAAAFLQANASAFRIQDLYFGASLKARFHADPLTDSRCPDIVIQPLPGTIYNSGKKKVSEHGGASHNDLNVALLLSSPGIYRSRVSRQVLTTQVAPTILTALSLPTAALAATRTDHTVPLFMPEDERGGHHDRDRDRDDEHRRDEDRDLARDLAEVHEGRGDGDRDGEPVILAVSRVVYTGNTFGNATPFPAIFADPTVSGIQGPVFIDQYLSIPEFPRLDVLPVSGLTSSFSSKSEGALALSQNGAVLTYMGYVGPVGAQGVSNSETPGATLTTNTAPTYDRAVAVIARDGAVSVTPETNAYSGDNPRAVVSVDGATFYMAGNADSSLNKDGTGPGTTIGARLGSPGSPFSLSLGTYLATDRPDESAKQHIKDSNFRAIGIFNGNLYVAKGSGGNGDDGVFQVHKGTGNGLPSGSANTITPLFSAPATDPVSGAASPYTSFGFWFADANTLYVADEGYALPDASGNPTVDALAGLEKWSLVGGTWKLDYVLQQGLDLAQLKTMAGYPVPSATTGLRNLTGVVNGDGSVTIFAITAQVSSISGGEPDPTKLVAIRDVLAAQSLPTGSDLAAHHRHGFERFVTLQTSAAGEVFRGVAIAPRDFDTRNRHRIMPHADN